MTFHDLFESCFKKGPRSVVRTLRENPLLTFFILLALATRLTFWFYTGRVWEDALITITAARNVWEGFGLTHHASEPYVQSFTSPISVLIPILGEFVQEGLLFLRLSSLAAAVATICFAYRIGVLLGFRWIAHVLVLTYLACDQLQIFFGMGGMETQVVTAVAVAVIYFYLSQRWWALGVACGLATISRPEFCLFLIPSVGIALLLFHRHAILKVVIPALAFAVPWYGFATLYYGSPVPNTIVAKSWSVPNRNVHRFVDGSLALHGPVVAGLRALQGILGGFPRAVAGPGSQGGCSRSAAAFRRGGDRFHLS